MTGGRSAWKLAIMSALIALSWSATSTGGTSDLARCAAIAAPDARLECYDALAGRMSDRATPAAAAPPPVAASAAAPAARPNPPAQTPAQSNAPATANAATTAAAADNPVNFGLSPAQLHPTATGPASIQAHVAKIVQSQLGIGHPSVVLDNGQTWTFTEIDDDARLGPGDPVTIRRAALGSFVMTTPSKHSYHVRRAQ
jgi:hypothetical protein